MQGLECWTGFEVFVMKAYGAYEVVAVQVAVPSRRRSSSVWHRSMYRTRIIEVVRSQPSSLNPEALKP